MTTELLHRIQFGLTVSFHFIFPPMSLGLGVFLIILGVKSVRTGDPRWRQLSLFWVRIYGLIFALGIATGIVQEFMFGTNWADYSRFVGNIFGALLAAEGIFAFMIEGGFLGLMLFGGTRLGNRMWLFATTMVVFGATFSAFWIIMANSWMQTPQGFEIRDVGQGNQAFMTSFREVVFNPSFGPRILHTLVASWMVGMSLVLSVAAFYLLKRRHVELSKTMIRVALPIFTVLAILQVGVFGANQAIEVANEQPEKLAAMEGLYDTQSCAPMYLVGWTDPENETTSGISIPCLLSFLTYQDTNAEVTGLEAFPRDEWANASVVFQVYHLMIDLGMLFIAIGVVACGLWAWKRKLWEQRWMLRVFVGLDRAHPAGDALGLVDRGIRTTALGGLADAADRGRRLPGGVVLGGRVLDRDVRGPLRGAVRALPLPAERQDPRGTARTARRGGHVVVAGLVRRGVRSQAVAHLLGG